MAGWDDIALTLGNPMYPQLSAPGGPLQDMNGWQKAMLGIGMLGSLFSNMGNMGVVGRRKDIGGALASIGPALTATQRQAMQAAGPKSRFAQAVAQADGPRNRTREWMRVNAVNLGLSPLDVAGMDPAELADRFWQANRASRVVAGGTASAASPLAPSAANADATRPAGGVLLKALPSAYEPIDFSRMAPPPPMTPQQRAFAKILPKPHPEDEVARRSGGLARDFLDRGPFIVGPDGQWRRKYPIEPTNPVDRGPFVIGPDGQWRHKYPIEAQPLGLAPAAGSLPVETLLLAPMLGTQVRLSDALWDA